VGDCVFCTREGQPEALFETAGLRVVPDKFPMTPGHILIIPKEHLPCLAAAPEGLLAEVEAAAARVRHFLREAYGSEAMAWENGVAGQTVPHAHLHLLPLPLAELPPVFRDAELVPIDGWEPVRRHYERHGSYRYVAFRGERRLIAGYSPVMARLREFWEQHLPVRWDAGKRDWLRLTTPEDVREVGRRWAEWVKGPTAKRARTRSP
jgi:diadenosine tetraphosphate (Ap4A) HIT family hydrolase